MPDGEHIGIETIEKYLLGKLADEKAEAVRRHLETCPLCGLELKRLRRFHAIDADENLARRAEWLYARTRLEKAFRERIAPSAEGTGAPVISFPRARRAARWLVPAAAAAAVVFMIAHYTMNGRSPAPAPGGNVMRGTPASEYRISLEEPLGDIDARPAVFKWKSNRADDFFTLEIFTPTLEKIYEARNIRESPWTAPDTLAVILEPGVMYLWSVRGYRGLERATASPNGWFRVERPALSKPAPNEQ
jgi:hypothetical protein